MVAEGLGGGFNAAFGMRYVGEQFANNSNTLTLDGYGLVERLRVIAPGGGSGR